MQLLPDMNIRYVSMCHKNMNSIVVLIFWTTSTICSDNDFVFNSQIISIIVEFTAYVCNAIYALGV